MVSVVACGGLPDRVDPSDVFTDYTGWPTDAGVAPAESDTGESPEAMADAGSEESTASDAATGCVATVGYAQIAGLLRSRCGDCHGGAGGLDVGSQAALLRGGDHGPAIVEGDCQGSVLYQKLVDPVPFGVRMPAGAPPLSTAEVDLLCRFIDDLEQPSAACAGGGSGAAELTDVTAPDFDGCDSVDERADTCLLTWDAASDDTTAPEAIRYRVYAAPADGAFPSDPVLEVTGQTAATITLPPDADYDITVIALDEAGNQNDGGRIRTCSLD